MNYLINTIASMNAQGLPPFILEGGEIPEPNILGLFDMIERWRNAGATFEESKLTAIVIKYLMSYDPNNSDVTTDV